MIDLYTDSSPNGSEAAIAPEGLGLPCMIHHVRTDASEHRGAGYLRVERVTPRPAGRRGVVMPAASRP